MTAWILVWTKPKAVQHSVLHIYKIKKKLLLSLESFYESPWIPFAFGLHYLPCILYIWMGFQLEEQIYLLEVPNITGAMLLIKIKPEFRI